MRQSPEQVFRQNTAAGEPGSFLHELKQQMLTFAADYSRARQIDHDPASIRVSLSLLPSPSELPNPGFS